MFISTVGSVLYARFRRHTSLLLNHSLFAYVLLICGVCLTQHSTRRLFTLKVSTKTTVVNFSVKQLGLEAQLLGIVVQREQPSLEEQSSELTVKVISTYPRAPKIPPANLKYSFHYSSGAWPMSPPNAALMMKIGVDSDDEDRLAFSRQTCAGCSSDLRWVLVLG